MLAFTSPAATCSHVARHVLYSNCVFLGLTFQTAFELYKTHEIFSLEIDPIAAANTKGIKCVTGNKGQSEGVLRNSRSLETLVPQRREVRKTVA